MLKNVIEHKSSIKMFLTFKNKEMGSCSERYFFHVIRSQTGFISFLLVLNNLLILLPICISIENQFK